MHLAECHGKCCLEAANSWLKNYFQAPYRGLKVDESPNRLFMFKRECFLLEIIYTEEKE